MIAPLLALAAALQAAPLSPASPAPPAPRPATTPADPVAADWLTIPDDQLLVMTLAGNRTVVYPARRRICARTRRQCPQTGAGALVGRDERLPRAGQLGDAMGATRPRRSRWPPGIAPRPAAEYDLAPFAAGGPRLAQMMTRPDAYSTASGITSDGWATASDGAAAWLTHCYATVGVARDASPDTGSGAELFTAIGGSARRLDRNYTVVGRVIEGMPYLSGLARSGAAMGMYATAGERVPIVSVRLANDIPAAVRPRFEYRAADNPRFGAMIAAKVDPKPPTIGLGGLDVCDVPLATRRAP